MKAIASSIFIVLLLISCSKGDSSDPTPAPGEKSSEKSVLADPVIVGINEVSVNYISRSNTYELTVPATLDVKSLKLSIVVSPKATISPNPEQARDYSSPVSYTVTAEDGSKQTFVIKVLKQAVSGKACLVSRIENINGSQYLNFRYDALGRVIEMDAFDMYKISKHDEVKLYFKYDDATGDLLLAEMRDMPESLGGGTYTYKPIYTNGKLTRLAWRSNTGGEGSRDVKLDASNLFVGWDNYASSQCYVYSNGAATKLTLCSSGFVYNSFDYAQSVAHFMRGLNAYPGFLRVFSHIFYEIDDTYMLTHPGLYMPTKRVSYRFSAGTIWERANVTYQINEQGYPVEMTVVTDKKLDTDFPFTNTSKIKISYTNCQ